jgi:hypothetical protein
MKLNAFTKNLIMALVGFIATTIGTFDVIDWGYVAIASVGFTLVYFGKNWKWPSMSALGLELRDWISGFVITAGMAVSSLVADWFLPDFTLTLPIFLKTVGGALLGYILKTGLTDSTKTATS